MADVTVTIGAQDDGSLAAAMANARSQLSSLGTLAGGAGFGPGGRGPGGGLPGGGAGFQATAQSANQAAGAINNVARAQNNVAEASSQAGSMVERMFERMVIRAGIAAVIFGTIQEIIKAFGEAISFEKAETQFQYLIGSGQKFEAQLKAINQEFEVTHTAKDKLMDVEQELYRLGDPVQNLSADMQMLDQYAKVTGEDASKLAHGLTDLRLGRASIDEMYQMTALMGEQGQGLHDQIASYQRIEAELPNIQREQELNLRLQEHQWMLADRQRDATNRLTDVQGDFAGQVGITKTLFEAMAQGYSAQQYSHVAATQVAGVSMEKAAQVEAHRLEMGEQQIEQEEGLSQAEIKRLERAGLINAKTLEGAAERRRADQERAQQQQREDERFGIQIRMEILRFTLEQKSLALQGQVLEGLQKFVGLSEGLTNNLQTAAAAFEKLGADIAEIAKDMPGLAHSLATIANILDSMVNKVKEIKQMREETKSALESPLTPTGEVRTDLPILDPRFRGLQKLTQGKGPGEADIVPDWMKSIPFLGGGGVQATAQEEFEVGKKALMAAGVNRPESDYTAAQIRAAGHKQLAKESGIATEDTLVEMKNLMKNLFTISAGP
jgi:uncharacterized phage infection (PIP) family protein YhgE